MDFELTAADKAPVPTSYFTEPRYLGYREADFKKPYAKYFTENVLPVQPQVADAFEELSKRPIASHLAPRLSNIAEVLCKPGYVGFENGYTVNEDGHVVIAALTDMPGVTGEMFDWWCWWSAVEAARYKLWHPKAHLFTRFADDRTKIKGLTDRQRVWGNSFYIDEYIGTELAHIKASVVFPEKFGFPASKPGETICFFRGGLSRVPIAGLWMVHQIRATPSGSEMRTRAFVNDMAVLKLPAHTMTSAIGKVMTTPGINGLLHFVLSKTRPVKLKDIGVPMLSHVAEEMNHLASFLPKLYDEFARDSRV